MFNSNQNKEFKNQMEIEQRSMEFGREQMGFQVGANMDQPEYAQHQEKLDLLKWQQDLGDELIVLKNRLRRMVLDGEEWKPLKQLVGYDDKKQAVYQQIPPYLNEIGIAMIEDQIYPLISRNLINSNLDETRILKILENTCNSIADNLADYFDYYDADFINFDVILRLIKNTIIPAPFRALNDGERRHQRTMNKRIDTFHDSNAAPQKKKMLGLF